MSTLVDPIDRCMPASLLPRRSSHRLIRHLHASQPLNSVKGQQHEISSLWGMPPTRPCISQPLICSPGEQRSTPANLHSILLSRYHNNKSLSRLSSSSTQSTLVRDVVDIIWHQLRFVVPSKRTRFAKPAEAFKMAERLHTREHLLFCNLTPQYEISLTSHQTFEQNDHMFLHALP